MPGVVQYRSLITLPTQLNRNAGASTSANDASRDVQGVCGAVSAHDSVSAGGDCAFAVRFVLCAASNADWSSTDVVQHTATFNWRVIVQHLKQAREVVLTCDTLTH